MTRENGWEWSSGEQHFKNEKQQCWREACQGGREVAPPERCRTREIKGREKFGKEESQPGQELLFFSCVR